MTKEEVEAAIAALESTIWTIDTWVLVFAVILFVGLTGETVLGIAHWLKDRQLRPLRAVQAQLHATELAQLNNETARLRMQLAPRWSMMTQAQQHELTAKLSEFKDQRGTVVASPSTPESEWFARVLTAPLKEAGWNMEILPGTSTATVLFPTGVVIQYGVDMQRSLEEQSDRSAPAMRLAEALKELGIDATAIPGPVQPPFTIQITISTK